ncbi:putative 3-hydroxyphenylpropionic transporter MhpT [compost metagenome]
MSGPLLAGQMLASGSGAATVLMAAAPGVFVAAASVLIVLNKNRQSHLGRKLAE